MATTRMTVKTGLQVYHVNASSGDMPESKVGTSDTAAQGLGGSGDFQIESDSTMTHSTAHKVQGTTGAAIGSGAITAYIHIKNTGFSDSDKTTSTAQGLKIGLGSDTQHFTLEPGESICLHGLGSGCDNLSEIYLDSESGNVYAEVTYH
tara:strand:- start:2332 stop:2778 length:447 start_codon:yes stop_codon:yes gene_type:complete